MPPGAYVASEETFVTGEWAVTVVEIARRYATDSEAYFNGSGMDIFIYGEGGNGFRGVRLCIFCGIYAGGRYGFLKFLPFTLKGQIGTKRKGRYKHELKKPSSN